MSDAATAQTVTIDGRRVYVFDEQDADALCCYFGSVNIPPPGTMKPRTRLVPSYLLTNERKNTFTQPNQHQETKHHDRSK